MLGIMGLVSRVGHRVASVAAVAVMACSLAAPTTAELTAGLDKDGGQSGDGSSAMSSDGAGHCAPLTSHCTSGQECCSGDCTGMACVNPGGCIPAGDTCGQHTGSCCGALTCTSGVCTTCASRGATCSQGSECCSGQCRHQSCG